MVIFNVTVESHPMLLGITWLAVVLVDVYANPSIQVSEAHAVWTSVPTVLLIMLKLSVTTESQPNALGIVCVAEELFEL